MSSTAHQLPLKTRANSAAADPNGTAVALTERPAAWVSFRWHQPGLPPTQNDHSAPPSLTAACQFSGNNAISATSAVTTATFATY